MLSRRSLVGSGLVLAAVGGRLLAQSAVEPAIGGLVRAGFKGAILAAGTDRYQAARRMFVANPRHPNNPAMIAQCADENDIRRALDYARSTNSEFSVRAGGHDLQAASMCSGLVIDLSPLKSIMIDEGAKTVRIGAGVRSSELNAALAERGLAAALGCAGQVGVSGLVLGGGLGWLVGKYGAACDHLVGARIVTANGRLLVVGRENHPDLLWALRGGGGNFEIVSELTLRVHPRPIVTTGIVALRGPDIAGFLRRLSEFHANATDDLDIEPFAMPTANGPMIFIKACYSGDPSGADRALAPLCTLGNFVADDLAARPYTGLIDPTAQIATLFRTTPTARQPDDVPGLHVGAISTRKIGGEAADVLAERLQRGVGNWAAGFAHLIHGAAARVGPDHSPMPRRDGLLTAYVLASWRRAGDAGPAMTWIDETIGRLRPYAQPTYLNYLTDEAPGAVRAAYGPSFNRLRRIKRRYDPQNIFRRGRNIPPG